MSLVVETQTVVRFEHNGAMWHVEKVVGRPDYYTVYNEQTRSLIELDADATVRFLADLMQRSTN